MKIAVIIVTTGVAAMALGVLVLVGAVAGEALGLGQGFGLTVSLLCIVTIVAGLRIGEHAVRTLESDRQEIDL